MDAQTISTSGDHSDELAHVVARIRARNTALPLARPSADVIAAVIAHLRDEEPLSDGDLAEHERLWNAVEDEMRRRDQANDRAEGLS